MVAAPTHDPHSPTLPPTLADLRDLLDERARLQLTTVADYHRMVEAGIIESGAPFELLEGQVVARDKSRYGGEPMSIDPPHYYSVRQLGKLDAALVTRGCHMRTEAPLTLPPFDEPEPDGAIVRGGEDDDRRRHPGGADVLCVIEVADSSLRRDRTTKLRIYAAAGIPRYVIVNLIDGCVEVYHGPLPAQKRYARSDTLTREAELSLPTAEGVREDEGGSKGVVRVAVASLLP